MKRDFDLVRKILGRIAEFEPMRFYSNDDFIFEGYDQFVVLEHLDLLREAGLITGTITRGLDRPGGVASIGRLTWKGHDFLEASKDETIWTKAKNKILEPLGGVAFDILLEWLKCEARERLGLPPSE